jgi:spermidine/putrescine transport system permease protein
VLYAFLYAPILVVILFSFNQARHGVVWEGFTTRWYRALFADPVALAAARNTLLLGLASTAIATVLGSLLAFGLKRCRLPFRRAIAALVRIPVFIPDIVMAASLLLFFALVRQSLGFLELGLTTMILAHVTFQIPFVTIIVGARLVGLNPILEEAARDLGATGWQTLRYVTLPLVFPGIVAGALLAFTLSLDDFVVSFFTSGPGSTTLPILIYSSVKRGITPEINALAALIILASILGTATVTYLQRARN